ncbi:uracil-DNA glycosylase [Sphingosinicella sp. BN140058]|uniref:uracil-DNA glycosylase n=1 Tax=Sphingosinicella sp. BN140058 TaxID=1892855 RepID=UPI001013B7DE|nr:uracil-DNA glycosylase [Sphingosinicella sp. BN140058]QAY78603.1 uracil-DNA glycosylase [Sphingosinicella sp. BN140058]
MERGNEHWTPAAAASVLQWWSDAGVDVLIDEEPRDWLRPQPVPSARAAEPAPLDARRQSAPPAARVPAAPAAPAEDLPGQLDMFQAYLRTSESLSFAAPAASRVCPAGDPASGLMIVADMPSTEDCGTGTLLSGEPGRLFDRMLAAIGRDRNSIYLAALSCLRSPDGRFSTDSARNCATLARHHVGLVAPKAVLLLGDACAKALTGLSMAQARGRWHEIQTQSGPVKALVSIPPATLLNLPAAKAHAWADLQMLIEEVNA